MRRPGTLPGGLGLLLELEIGDPAHDESIKMMCVVTGAVEVGTHDSVAAYDDFVSAPGAPPPSWQRRRSINP